ncbi:MAG: ABC transporter permease [Pseudomonadota bacterium]
MMLSWRTGGDLDQQLDDEIQFHLELETDANMRRGMSRQDAQRKAQLDFGSVEAVREEMRAQARTYWIRQRCKELWIGLLQLFREPSYALTLIGVLTAGIGLGIAVLMVAHQILIAPLDYTNSARVVVVHEMNAEQSSEPEGASPGNFFDWVDRQSGFAVLGAAAPFGLDLRQGDRTVSLDTSRVTLDYLQALGVRMRLGSRFDESHFLPGAEPAVILSWSTWQTRFDADQTLVGKTIELDGRPTQVIGVLDPATPDLRGGKALIPMDMGPGEAASRSGNYLTVVGRLQRGVSLATSAADMRNIAQQLATDHPVTNSGWMTLLVPLRDHLLGEEQKIAKALLVSCLCLLGIVFANVGALAMARGLSRAPELATRFTLGARRGELIRQLAIENLIPVLISFALGLGLAAGILKLLAPNAPTVLADLGTFQWGPILVLALAGLALLTLLISVVLPAVRLTGHGLASAMRMTAAQATRSKRTIRVQQGLIAMQICLAMLLIAGAGLLHQSLQRLLDTDLGFADQNRVAVELFLYDLHPNPAARSAFQQDLITQLKALPELGSVATGSAMPLMPALYSLEGVEILDGRAGNGVRAATNAISPAYFDVLAIPVVDGRNFSTDDDFDARRVVVISQSFADKYFAQASPLGEQLRFGVMGRPQAWTIVGVVGDVLDAGPAKPPQATIYVPNAQARVGGMSVIATAVGDPEKALASLQDRIWELSPGQSMSLASTVTAKLDDALRPARFVLALLTIFAATAIAIAMIGLYGTTAYFVKRRQRETTIRIALGLTPLRALMWVQSQTLLACLAGILVGVIVVLTGLVWLQELVHTTSIRDPFVIVTSALLILALATLAATPSAIRSANTNPSLALRQD